MNDDKAKWAALAAAENDANRRRVKRGDIVTFKPEWRDAGDEGTTFYAMEDEDGGRVKVGFTVPGWRIQPNQVVSVGMLEL